MEAKDILYDVLAKDTNKNRGWFTFYGCPNEQTFLNELFGDGLFKSGDPFVQNADYFFSYNDMLSQQADIILEKNDDIIYIYIIN